MVSVSKKCQFYYNCYYVSDFCSWKNIVMHVLHAYFQGLWSVFSLIYSDALMWHTYITISCTKLHDIVWNYKFGHQSCGIMLLIFLNKISGWFAGLSVYYSWVDLWLEILQGCKIEYWITHLAFGFWTWKRPFWEF